MNDIITFDVQLQVRVRKYPVDISNLQMLLKSHKNHTNKDLAKILEIPLTQVEHYFRTDKYFAIPDPDIWFRLKDTLNICNDSFDESIMTFETKPNVYEKSNRLYFEDGISPTILCGEEIKILIRR